MTVHLREWNLKNKYYFRAIRFISIDTLICYIITEYF
jgi:hypothetical protein